MIAVPTSVGYGTSFGGLTALLAMLNSIASGLSVVNIDNGFGAGYMAAMINNLCVRNAGNDPWPLVFAHRTLYSVPLLRNSNNFKPGSVNGPPCSLRTPAAWIRPW